MVLQDKTQNTGYRYGITKKIWFKGQHRVKHFNNFNWEARKVRTKVHHLQKMRVIRS